MRPSIIIMFVCGFGAMFWLWKTEWDHNAPDAVFSTVACNKAGACDEPWSKCIPNPAFPEGLCSKTCTLSRDCPGDWCCLDPTGQGKSGDALSCLPPDQCSTAKE